MKRYSLFTRGPFVLILLAAGLFFGACAEDPDRLAWEYYSLRNTAIASRVRVIYASEPFGNPPPVASASVPEPLKNRIRELLLSMHQDPRGAAILGELLIDRFIPPDEQLYDSIRHMLVQSSVLEDGHAATAQP